MTYILIIIIILLIIEKIIDKKNNNNESEKNVKNINYNTLYSKKDYLLTQQELKFYKLIKIVKAKDIKDFNKIKSKTIDFVITDTNCKIKFCIELDDPTHIKENRQQRDKFIEDLFKQLNIKLIRIPVQNYYNLKELEEKIKGSI